MSVDWLVQVDILAAFSLIAAILIAIPLYWHLEAWNVGCVLYIFWIGGTCLINFINIMIWRDNVIIRAIPWCDIVTRFYIGSGVGVCCASLVINRRLYHIANISAVSITRADKRRNIISDLAIGLGIPVIAICLYWFYQGHRYDIVEGIGCVETWPNTWLAYILFVAWPIPIGLVSGTYCIFTLRAFFQRRQQFSDLMASNNNLTYHRYFRLMALAAVEVLLTVPLGIYNTVSNLRLSPMYNYIGLADLHWGFSRIGTRTAEDWRSVPAVVSVLNFRMWVPIACALLFFGFFGLAEEARKHYKVALSSVAKKVGITTFERSTSSGFASTGSKQGSQGFGRITIPTFVQHRAPRRASVDSFCFSDKLSTNISISEVDEKAPYSPVGSSGSSTYIPSPVDAADKSKTDATPSSPIETTFLDVPHIEFPKPPQRARVHDATPVRPEPEDVPSSVPHNSIDMV